MTFNVSMHLTFIKFHEYTVKLKYKSKFVFIIKIKFK